MNCADADKLLERAGIDKSLSGMSILDQIDKYISKKEIHKNGHMVKALHYKKFSEKINAMTDKEAIEFGKYLIRQDPREEYNVRGVETDAIAFFMRAHEKLAEYMEEARPTWFGYKNRTDIHDDFIRASDFKNKDPKMTEFFNRYMEIKTHFRERWEYATGDKVNPRRGVDYPQLNDPVKISSVSDETWFSALLEGLDLHAMGISKEKLRELTVTGGDRKSRYAVISRNFEQAIGHTHDADSLGRYKQKRFFIFKDSESWLKYQKRFGSDSLYASLNDDLHQMAIELSIVEKFGPNPKEMLRHVLNMIADKTNEKGFIRGVELDYGYHTGVLNIPKSEQIATFGANLRNVASTVLLGSAPVISITDMAFSSANLRSNGFRMSNALKISSKNLFRNIINRKKSSIESGKMYAGMLHALDTNNATLRVIETEGSGFLAKSAHAQQSVSGLQAMTTASKAGGNAEMHSTLAMGNWNPRIDIMLKRYGITEKDIKLFKEAGTVTMKDYNNRIMPNYEDMDFKTAEAFIGAVKMEGLKGTLEMTLANQSIMKQGVQPGTYLGEIIRLAAQFGQFPLQALIGPAKYGFSKKGIGRVEHLSSLIFGTTILGTFAVQFGRISDGYEPYDWDSEELWMKGFMKGGSLSFIGDIFFADKSYGSGLGDIVPAPMFSLFNKHLWQGVFADISISKDKDFQDTFRALFKTGGIFVEDINPLKRLWYTRYIVKRIFGEHVLRATNPNFDAEQTRKELKRELREQR